MRENKPVKRTTLKNKADIRPKSETPRRVTKGSTIGFPKENLTYLDSTGKRRK